MLCVSAMVVCVASAQNIENDSIMNESPIDLEQVVVTATRTAKKLKDVPVLTQVISKADIERRGINNVQDLLTQEVPGLEFQEVGYGTSINLQGLGAKHILILVDGERLAGENSGNIDYQRINTMGIERIEIVKGASSALYGSGAMGGVINIITRKAKRNVEVSAQARYGERSEKNFDENPKDGSQYKYRKHLDKPNLSTSLSLGLRLGSLTSQTDVAYKSADAYQLYDRKGVVKHYKVANVTVESPVSTTPTSVSGYEDLNISERLTYKPVENLTLRAHVSHYELNRYDFVADNIYEQNEDIAFGGSAEWQMSEEQTLGASMHVDRYSRYDKFERKAGRNLDYENNISQPRLAYTRRIGEHNTFTVGAEGYVEELYGNRFNASSAYETKKQWMTTLYAQDDWDITDVFSVVVGLRADYHKEYELNVTPKISLMYKPYAVRVPIRWRLNYAMGFRSPTLKELYMNWDHLGMFWMYGNADLKPEHNNYVSLSAEYACKVINVSANVYSNWFKDKIEGVWKTGENGMQEYHYTNLQKSRLTGFELMLRAKIGNHADLYTSYNYLYTSKTDGYRLTAAAPHSATFRLEGNSHAGRFATIANIQVSLTGSKDYSIADTYTQDNTQMSYSADDFYDAHVDAFALCNLSVAQMLGNHCQLTAGLNNLFDYHADVVSFNSSTSPGRRYFVSVQINF